jgi:hypothetical protein
MHLEFVILWYYNPNPPVPINLRKSGESTTQKW